MKPYLVIEWNDTQSAAKGWLVIYNFVRGYAGGGIRMHPQVTRDDVIRMAETMAYKYQACESLDCGGCKGGIAYSASASDAHEVLYRYIKAMMPYIELGVSLGSDLGTKYGEILEIFAQFGCPMPMSKRMKQNPKMNENIEKYNQISASKINGISLNDFIAGFGVACAADEAYKQMYGQQSGEARIVIQGMGRVAFAAAEQLRKFGHRIIGMADSSAFIYSELGVDPSLLRDIKKTKNKITQSDLPDDYRIRDREKWLEQDCDVLVPAAISNAINENNAEKVKAKLIVEGANIPISTEGDEILKKNGKYLICDFTANLLEAWLYDVILFERVEPQVNLILAEGEALCRRNAKKQMSAMADDGVYARISAKELFKPTQQEDLDY